MGRGYLAPGCEASGWGHPFQSLGHEIRNVAALQANQVVVGGDIAIESQPIMMDAHGCDQTLIDQEPQGAIHRIESDRADFLLNPTINRFGVGVRGCADRLAEDFDPLMRNPNAFSLPGVDKLINPPLDLCRVKSHAPLSFR